MPLYFLKLKAFMCMSAALDFLNNHAIKIMYNGEYCMAYFLIEEDAEEFDVLVKMENHFHRAGIFEGLEHGRRPAYDVIMDECLEAFATSFDPEMFKRKRLGDVE